MAKKNENITVSDLNKSLKKIDRDARRVNKAMGWDTFYAENGRLFKIKPSGKKQFVGSGEDRRNYDATTTPS